jgi:hypothetical protein
MKRAALLLALCLPGLALAAVPGDALAPFKASYSIKWNGMAAGTGELQLEQLPDGRWAYTSRVHGRGLFRLAIPANQVSRSVFRIVNGKVVPDSYQSDEHEQQLSFDWGAGRVTGTVNRKRINLPTQPGLLDPLSVQVALMQELLSGRTPARFVLIDEERIKDYLYAVEGSEELESSAGTHRTDIFSSKRPGSRKATYFWCAPQLGYIPLKVERRDGREVEWSMQLASLQQ